MKEKIEEIAVPVNAVILERTKFLVVKNQDEYELAAKYIVENKCQQGKVVAWFQKSKSAALEAHRAICAQEKDLLEPLKSAEAEVKRGMGDYQLEQDRLRIEAQKKAAEQERQRREDERARIALDAQVAIAGITDGMAGEDDEGFSPSMPEPEPFVPEIIPDAPTAEGVSTRFTWDYEIVDASAIPRAYLIPDEKKIAGVVKSLGEASEIPGVRIFKKAIISGRVK